MAEGQSLPKNTRIHIKTIDNTYQTHQNISLPKKMSVCIIYYLSNIYNFKRLASIMSAIPNLMINSLTRITPSLIN